MLTAENRDHDTDKTAGGTVFGLRAERGREEAGRQEIKAATDLHGFSRI
jgi:hypothetical protein